MEIDIHQRILLIDKSKDEGIKLYKNKPEFYKYKKTVIYKEEHYKLLLTKSIIKLPYTATDHFWADEITFPVFVFFHYFFSVTGSTSNNYLGRSLCLVPSDNVKLVAGVERSDSDDWIRICIIIVTRNKKAIENVMTSHEARNNDSHWNNLTVA